MSKPATQHRAGWTSVATRYRPQGPESPNGRHPIVPVAITDPCRPQRPSPGRRSGSVGDRPLRRSRRYRQATGRARRPRTPMHGIDRACSARLVRFGLGAKAATDVSNDAGERLRYNAGRRSRTRSRCLVDDASAEALDGADSIYLSIDVEWSSRAALGPGSRNRAADDRELLRAIVDRGGRGSCRMETSSLAAIDHAEQTAMIGNRAHRGYQRPA